MSIRKTAAAGLSVLLLSACDADRGLAPAMEPGVAARNIVAATVCDGAAIPVAECEALVALFNSTNGPAWTIATPWGVDPNPCEWQGVACTGVDHGNVLSLGLHSRGLTGPLPAEIGNLVALEEVWLPGNAIVGPLPPILANLSALRILELSNNALTGTIPDWFGDMHGLEGLYLHNNAFSGAIPGSLGSMASLAVLTLGSNALTGPIPTELANFRPDFFMLTLFGNALSGQVPLAVAEFGESIAACVFHPQSGQGLFIPDTPEYRAADVDGDGVICMLPLVSAGEIGAGVLDAVDELVPAAINHGQANSLKTKVQQAMSSAANGQYTAAINQMGAFISQVNSFVANGTLTPEQGAALVQQAEAMIAMWQALP